jgi:hypothetical protein
MAFPEEDLPDVAEAAHEARQPRKNAIRSDAPEILSRGAENEDCDRDRCRRDGYAASHSLGMNHAARTPSRNFSTSV